MTPAPKAQNREPELEPEEHHRAIWTDNRISSVLVVIAMLLGAILTVEGVRLERGNKTRDVISRIDNVSSVIRDSVDPGGKRFQRGQQQTADAVASINEVTQLAVFCGQKYTDVPSIQGCVLYEYRRAHPVVVPTTTVP